MTECHYLKTHSFGTLCLVWYLFLFSHHMTDTKIISDLEHEDGLKHTQSALINTGDESKANVLCLFT